MSDYRARLFVLLGAVGLVLLIACGNVTGMLIARVPARRLELSVWAALGESRSRLVRQLIVESVILATTAGVSGIALALWLQPLILGLLHMEVPGIENAGVSTPMLFLAVALALASGLLAGIYPALSSTRANLAQELKAGAKTILGRGVGFVAIGIVLGGGAALGVTRLIQQMLFGVGPADLATFVGVGLFVLLVALVACLIPVWRAVRVDPSVALRAM